MICCGCRWGWLLLGEKSKNEIQWKPIKMILKNVIKINKVIFKDCDYIILKQIGKVLCYNSDENKIMFEIIVGLKVNDIFENLFETEECVYEFDLENEVKKINFVNFYDYFSSIHKLLRVYKTIHGNYWKHLKTVCNQKTKCLTIDPIVNNFCIKSMNSR